MGWLARVPDVSVDWRLPSIGGDLPRADERRYQLEEAHRLRVERSRRNIQNARVAYLGEVGQTARRVIAAGTWQTEQYAMRYPEERGRLDIIDDAVTMGCVAIVQEMAG